MDFTFKQIIGIVILLVVFLFVVIKAIWLLVVHIKKHKED